MAIRQLFHSERKRALHAVTVRMIPRILSSDAAVLNHAPAGGSEGGVNVFGAGFGFVHEKAVRFVT